MKRRTFIAFLGSTAAASPLAALAQRASRMQQIGVLMGLAEGDPEGQERYAAFRERLQKLGWTDGGNIRVITRWAAGDIARTQAYAAELAGLAPDVILVNTPPGLAALQTATKSIPVVFVQVVAAAAKYRVPAISQSKSFATAGGLMSYGADLVDLLRQAGPYVDRILRGAKPAELPVQASTKLELVINLKTAKALGLTIPQSILLRAENVIS